MKKTFVFGILFAVCASLFALDAEVIGIEGKAQVSTNGTTWAPVAVGSKIPQGATIQTGFKSSLKIKFKGSEITLDPMTRIKVDELSDKDNRDNAVVSMKIGGLTSNVKKVEDRRAGFTVKGPAATASVRGTILSEEVGYNRDTVRAIENTTMVWPSSSNGESEGSEKGASAIAPGQVASVDMDGGQKAPQSHASDQAVKLNGAVLLSSTEGVSSGAAGAAEFGTEAGGSGQVAIAKGQSQITVNYEE